LYTFKYARIAYQFSVVLIILFDQSYKQDQAQVPTHEVFSYIFNYDYIMLGMYKNHAPPKKNQCYKCLDCSFLIAH